MEELKRLFDRVKSSYDAGDATHEDIGAITQHCLSKLTKAKQVLDYGDTAGKRYLVYSDGASASRPFLRATLLTNGKDFRRRWDTFIAAARPKQHKFDVSEAEATKLVYTTVLAFAACYDIWRNKSRKTPGTYLEVVLGSLVSLIVPDAKRTKFIALPTPQGMKELVGAPAGEIVVENDDGAGEVLQEAAEDDAGKVSTDIVFNLPGDRGIVIPAKITTRERIVQPFAHQRILDSVFGVGRYVSLLACVSETQRDDKNGRVNEICVPGTIALFQSHLARLGGIFYLDPPSRYLKLAEAGVISVRPLGALLTGELHAFIQPPQKAPAVGRS